MKKKSLKGKLFMVLMLPVLFFTGMATVNAAGITYVAGEDSWRSCISGGQGDSTCRGPQSEYGATINVNDRAAAHDNFGQKDGYDLSWYEDGATSPTTTLVFRNYFDWQKEVTLTANYQVVEYSIEYNLAGGSADNPTSYNIESDTITLVNPTREGYEFIGWTGTNIEDPQMTVTIPTGTTGDLSYTANWIKVYTITYDLDGGVESTSNPVSYTVVTEDITLNNPTKEDYEFIGWTGSNGNEPEMTVTISKGSEGDKNYTANWKFIYKILSGGSQTHVINVNGDLTIVSNGNIENLVGIEVDGEMIDESNYTVVSGSTILTLAKDYLDSLSVGDHDVTFVYEDGTVSTKVTIAEQGTASTDANSYTSKNPQTGDNIILYVIMLIISMLSLTFVSKEALVNKA